MKPFDVTLVTYEKIPGLTEDDQRLARELAERGLRARSAVWSDPEVDWSAAYLTVLRSTWDYFHRPAEFLSWVERTERETAFVNSAALIRWNYDKHYLEDLRAKNIPIVPTFFVEQSAATALASVVEIFGSTELVIKPAIGGAAWGARRFAVGRDFGEALAHLDQLVAVGSAMIQPFLDSVLTERERSLVFFDGSYSHAYLKAPFNAGPIAGEAQEVPHDAQASELALAEAVLDSLDVRPSYARVDMTSISGRPHLMELELIEPALHFHIAPASEARMATALERRLEAQRDTETRVERAA